jgi:hypothetical protein
LKRLVVAVAVLLLIALILGLVVWACRLLLGPAVIEDNEGVWHIIDPMAPGVWLYAGVATFARLKQSQN